MTTALRSSGIGKIVFYGGAKLITRHYFKQLVGAYLLGGTTKPGYLLAGIACPGRYGAFGYPACS